MSSADVRRWYKCTRKRKYPDTPAGWALARSHAKDVMRKELRRGLVHRMDVYACRYAEDGHIHVGTKGEVFAIGWRGSNDARGWASVFDIEWTEEDDRTARTALKRLNTCRNG